ncbi:MAG: hypothetical protein JWO85_2155 [Candidatus Eremiobacteraeota bacterium]|nr:hypothetical protein [Candidatus Eremiobacteraeota bacterium]
MVNRELDRAAIDRDLIRLRGGAGHVEGADLHAGSLAEIDHRTVAQLKRTARSGLGDRVGVVRHVEGPEDRLERAVRRELVAHAAFHTIENFVSAGGSYGRI